MNRLFCVCNTKLAYLKILILSKKNINMFSIYCYNDILAYNAFINSNETIYIIYNKSIYSKYNKEHGNNLKNIFICVEKDCENFEYYECIKYIITHIYKQKEPDEKLILLLKKKSNANKHIGIIYNYLLDFQNKKNNKKITNKNFINKLIYKEIIFYALFSNNLNNCNIIDFENNMINYVQAYNKTNAEHFLALKIYKLSYI